MRYFRVREFVSIFVGDVLLLDIALRYLLFIVASRSNDGFSVCPAERGFTAEGDDLVTRFPLFLSAVGKNTTHDST